MNDGCGGHFSNGTESVVALQKGRNVFGHQFNVSLTNFNALLQHGSVQDKDNPFACEFTYLKEHHQRGSVQKLRITIQNGEHHKAIDQNGGGGRPERVGLGGLLMFIKVVQGFFFRVTAGCQPRRLGYCVPPQALLVVASIAVFVLSCCGHFRVARTIKLIFYSTVTSVNFLSTNYYELLRVVSL